jgi:hypothetical protein
MRRNPGVGVQGEPVDTGAARTREFRTFPFVPKSRANPSHVLSGPLSTGEALRDRGGQGASECGLVVVQGIIACGHGQAGGPDDNGSELMLTGSHAPLATHGSIGRHALSPATPETCVHGVRVSHRRVSSLSSSPRVIISCP